HGGVGGHGGYGGNGRGRSGGGAWCRQWGELVWGGGGVGSGVGCGG
nr:hypothetical protein [Tanacetum cinerariifolium]